VTVVVGTVQKLWDLLEQSDPVDAIVANFAVFNHIRDLRSLFHAMAAHLVPGGIVVTQMLNPFHLRDVRQLWWWRSVARSLGPGAVVFSGRDTTTYRHFSWSVARAAAAADFTVVERLSSAQILRPVGAVPRLGAFTSQFSIFVFRRRK
jgi:SAM-dependent methyltransferase